MASEITIAAAGGGKTTKLVANASSYTQGKVAIVTYTRNNVLEIRDKFFQAHPAVPPHVEIWSWYRFLLHELARPYQRALLDRRIAGLHWVEGRSPTYVPRARTTPFFLSDDARIYSDKIARFVVECDGVTSGAVVARLQDRFQAIFIDEIQDMAGYDLDMLELILASNIRLELVGDHRQATYSTNNAARNGGYAGAAIIRKFREWEAAGLASLTYANETFRCNQPIADLADSFYPQEPVTLSRNTEVTDHDGTFLVSAAAVDDYIATYQPQILRLDRRTRCNELAAMNFGEAKGMTFKRVLIFPHALGRRWLESGSYSHVANSAAKLYVGITRARNSVAFVFDGVSRVPGLLRYG